MSSRRLDLEIVARGLAPSRAKAQAAIAAGGVTVDGDLAARPADAVSANSHIEVKPAHPWVGRGALKLDHALTLWPVDVRGRIVLDVGASTGGFTQVCLHRGALRVYAVDVGRGQLDPAVAADGRVVSLEGTDARRLDRSLVPDEAGLVVCDASFIGLAKVLPAALALAAADADLVALVKPQFEVGPERVGKGGLVTDPAARAEAVTAVCGFLQAQGWTVRDTAASPIAGGDGNEEVLLWASRAQTKRPPAGGGRPS